MKLFDLLITVFTCTNNFYLTTQNASFPCQITYFMCCQMLSFPCADTNFSCAGECFPCTRESLLSILKLDSAAQGNSFITLQRMLFVVVKYYYWVARKKILGSRRSLFHVTKSGFAAAQRGLFALQITNLIAPVNRYLTSKYALHLLLLVTLNSNYHQQ